MGCVNGVAHLCGTDCPCCRPRSTTQRPTGSPLSTRTLPATPTTMPDSSDSSSTIAVVAAIVPTVSFLLLAVCACAVCHAFKQQKSAQHESSARTSTSSKARAVMEAREAWMHHANTWDKPNLTNNFDEPPQVSAE